MSILLIIWSMPLLRRWLHLPDRIMVRRMGDVVRRFFRLGMLCSVISCGILSTIFVVFRTFFIGLFTSDPSVYHYAQLRFLIVLTFECLTSSYEISGGCLRGFGRSMTPAILTVFGSCVLRLIWLATVCNWFHDYKLLMAIYPSLGY